MNAVVQPNTEPMLLRQDADGVATITLNRPQALNSFSSLSQSTSEEMPEISEMQS